MPVNGVVNISPSNVIPPPNNFAQPIFSGIIPSYLMRGYMMPRTTRTRKQVAAAVKKVREQREASEGTLKEVLGKMESFEVKIEKLAKRVNRDAGRALKALKEKYGIKKMVHTGEPLDLFGVRRPTKYYSYTIKKEDYWWFLLVCEKLVSKKDLKLISNLCSIRKSYKNDKNDFYEVMIDGAPWIMDTGLVSAVELVDEEGKARSKWLSFLADEVIGKEISRCAKDLPGHEKSEFKRLLKITINKL